MNLDELTFAELDLSGAIVSKRYLALGSALALGLIWQASAARAECFDARPSGAPFRTGCAIADSGPAVLRTAQMVNVAGAGSDDLPGSTQAVRFEGTATRIGVRYICTPSGFGQIANCTPH